MIRFVQNLSKSQLILVRQTNKNGSYSALLVMRTPVRKYAQNHFKEKCPDPDPPYRTHRFVYSVLGLTILGGAAIVYAKNTPPVRGWLQHHAPPLDDLVALAYQERETYSEVFWNTSSAITSFVRDFLFGKEGVPPMDFISNPEQDLEQEAIKGFAPKSYVSTFVQSEICEPTDDATITPVISKEVLELEEQLHLNTRKAIDAFKAATKSGEDYAKTLLRVIEMPLDLTAANTFSALAAKRRERDTQMKDAREGAALAREAAAKLTEMLANNEIVAPPEAITQTKRYIRTFMKDLDEAQKQFEVEVEKCIIMNKFHDKVVQARQAYKEELEAVFPSIDLEAKQLNVDFSKDGDIDLLLAFQMRQVQTLQNAYAELATVQAKKLQDALDCNDKEGLIEAKAQDLIKKERLTKELEFQSRALKMTAEHRRKMREELRKQALAQADLLKAALDRKDKEIQSRLNRLVSEQVERERVEFKKELAAQSAKLKAFEASLKQRQAAEVEARKAQALWAAAEALLAATRRPTEETRVDNEIQALEKAGQGDKLVSSVVKGIPPEARKNGILTEKALKDKFDALEKTTYKTALIPRDGASLPMYFISWLHSKLLFQKFAQIPRAELNNELVDFSKLDTFDIMQRARYYMDQGDMASAARYVNLLQGAPKKNAKCWLQNARDHLEVRQAAEAVMAHATLTGMLYL